MWVFAHVHCSIRWQVPSDVPARCAEPAPACIRALACSEGACSMQFACKQCASALCGLPLTSCPTARAVYTPLNCSHTGCDRHRCCVARGALHTKHGPKSLPSTVTRRQHAKQLKRHLQSPYCSDSATRRRFSIAH